MWLLIFICLSTVHAAPINQIQNAAPCGDTTDDTEHTGTTEAPAGQNVSTVIGPHLTESAETFQALDDGVVVQEGDILMSEDRNAVFNLWKDAIVYYEISEGLADRESEIQSAFDMISSATCIRFKKHTTEMNYIMIMDGRGCASFVGCQGGSQPLFFARKCTKGNLCHELIHALGLHHEHTRTDRNDFIDVLWQNIVPGKENNFKMNEGDTQNLLYDTGSIMHYGPYYFSKNGLPTLESKSSVGPMGQRSHLSQLDKDRLNKLYRCDERH